jgi:hypothetical protein
VGLLIGVGIGAAGKASTKTVTREGTTTTIASNVPARTVTVNHVVVHTHTKTVKEAAPASEPSSESSAASSNAGGGKIYSGNGAKSLGTLVVSQPSTIHWHAAGGAFAMGGCTSPCEHSIALDSQATSGESAVEPGTYHEVQVEASGEWGIEITPG